MTTNPEELLKLDELQQYFGHGLKIADGLEVHQPVVGDIVRLGENEYFSMVYTLTAIPSDVKAQLYKQKLDWEKVEDFELFCMLAPSLPLSSTAVLFGDALDFQAFEIVPIEGERMCYLRNRVNGVVIDVMRYMAIRNYLCKMHGIVKKPERAGNAFTKQKMIEIALSDLEFQQSQKSKQKSALKNMISTMVNLPGFKYKKNEILDMPYMEFMDSVARQQIINSSNALLLGCYMGNVDTKKMNKEELNYMRDIGR